MGKDLQARLNPVRRRQQFLGGLSGAAWAVLVSAVVVFVCAMGRWFAGWQISIGLMIGVLCAAPVVGYAFSYIRRRSWHGAAVAIDAHYRLKDRATTALEFL